MLSRLGIPSLLSSFLLLLVAGTGLAQSQPNFIIFVADDMAWNDSGPYGNKAIRTASIDRLAREGLRCDAAFLTTSSCSPSRCSMLTGRYPHNTGASELHQPLPKDQILFTTPLRQAGYYTACAGKWHLGNQAIEQFDLVKQGGGPGGEGEWVNVVKNRPKDKPFFFWLAAFDPHRDYAPGAIDPPHDPSEVEVPGIFPDTPVVREDLALYYDEIGRFDKYIGLVVAELERQQVLDETFLLVITDNGRPFPRCKTRINVDGIKTPFIVRYPPLVKQGTASNALISTLDIAPTILELAGIEPGPTFQGTSLVPVLEDPQQEVHEFIYAEHNWHDYRAFERAVISKDFLLIRNWVPEVAGTPPADAVRSPTYREMIRLFEAGELAGELTPIFNTPRPTRELYRWPGDLACMDNLAGKTEFADQQKALEQELMNWQQHTGDEFPGIENLTGDRFDRYTGKPLKTSK